MGWEEYFGNSNNSSGKDEEISYGGGNEIPVGTYEAVPAETNSSEQPYVETETPAEAAPLPPVTDAHYSPQYFIDEQKNRLNPEYQSPDIDKFDNAMVDGIANMVLERQKEHPEKWKDENGNYTDAGWDAEDPIWLEYVKPYEDEYQTKAAQQQTQAVQAEEVQSTSIRSGLQTSGALDTSMQTSTGETAPQGTTMGGVSSGLRTTPKAMPNENIMDTFSRVVSSDPKYARGDSWEADYDKMKLSEKIMYWLTPSLAGTDIKNAPEKSKYTQSVLSSAFSAGGPAAAAAIVTGLLGGPAGWVGLAVGGSLFGYNYTKSIGLHEGIDAVDKVTEWSDWGDPIGQELWGNLSYALYQTTGGELSDPAQFFTNIKTVLEHPKEIWNAMPGKNDEYNSTVTDAVLKMSSNIGADAFGNFMSRFIVNSLSALVDEDPYRLERGQTTRANQGLTGVYTPEYYGAQAQQLLLDLGMDLYNQGVTDEADLEYLLSLYVTREYGDISNISEFTEHELADVANLAEGMTPRAIGAYADVIGDTNLKTAAAASTGSLAGDILDNVPILPDVVRQIGRMTGHNNWLETSGSYQDVFAQWNVENLTNSTDQLTNLDRRFSGITKDNKLKGGIFTPNANPNSVKNPFAKGAIAFKNLFSYTNEYKAAYEGDQIFDYITIGIEDALRARPTDNPDDALMRVRQFIDEIANPELIEKGSPFYENAQSVLFNSIRDDLALAVRQNRQSIDKIIQKYELQQKPRAALNALSEALGLQPSKVLDMYDNHKTILTQMIVDEAEKNGGKLPGIDLDVTGREFGEQVIQMIAPFSAKGGEAWNVRQIVAQMSSTIADGVTDTIINKYGIQPEGFMYRFGDMIKKMQNLVLLGLSPSYLANNFVNNVATRTALGYGGWMSPNQINSWMDRFGYTPERFKESITGQIEGKTGDSNYEKLNAAIRNEKQKVDGTGFKKNLADAMKKVGDAGSWASNTFGIFGNLSGKVESMESQQIITKAMMTYMARTWKPGINFRKMPAQLEAAIRAINPGMVDAIYKAISAGMNMEEIESAIYGTYVAPSVQDNLLEAATNLGIENPDDVVTEYFIGSGLYAQLNEALKGKRGEEIDKVVDQFAEHLKSVLSFQMATDLSARSEAVAKDVNNTNSPFITATEHANNMADQMLDVWLKGQNLNQNIFMRRLREDMDPIAFHKMYQQHQKNLNERWKNVYATAEQTYDGITKGLGFGDKNRRAYLKAMNKKNQAWIKFYNETQPKAFQVYLDAIEWRLDDTWTKVENGKRIPGTWETRTEKAWKTYQENITKAIKKVYTEEAKQQKAMDAAFLAGLKDAVGNIKSAEVDTVIAPQLEAIQNKRNEIIEQNRKVREIADNTKNLDKKNDAWNEASEKLKELEGEYYKLQQQMYADVRGMASFATNVTADNETDHEANIQANAAQEKAEKNQKTAKEVADRLVDRILKGEDELNNLAPDNWSEFLRRDSLREVALKAGATKEQADAYARLVGAYAKAWERKNPGKDFFTDHLNMRVEGYDVGVTVRDTDGALHQVETIAKADVNTPEFKAWHGDHPENFKDGKPLSVFHGSKAWFDHFRRDLLGSFTNAVSAKMGFFFASSKKNSDHYAQNAPSRLDLAEEYLHDALDIDLEGMFYDAAKDIEWASNNQGIFPNGLKDYINPNDILNNAERIRNEFLGEFGEDADIFEFFINRVKESRQNYEEFLASIQSGKKKLDADAYEPYYKNIEEYIDSYKFNREKYSDPADVTEDVLREIRKEYQIYYDEFLDSGIEIDRVYPKLKYFLQELRHPQTLSPIDVLFIANELNYYNSIFSQLISDTDFGILSEDEMQLLLTGKDLTSETVFGNKFTNADKLRNLESEYFEAALGLDSYSKAISRIYYYDDVKENFNRILNTPENPNVREFYLSFKNPYIVDYKKRNRADVIRYSQAIKYAIDNGYDAVILKNTYDPYLTDIYVVFNENQMKSVYNSGEWSDPKNFYHQKNEQRVKGQFKIEDGEKVVQLFRGSDFSTLVHETMGHGFSTTLDDAQIEALAAYNGWTARKYKQLENQFYYDFENMSEADRTAWVDAQERFAYGFEQYLLEGKAPNIRMRSVFESFRKFLMEIYQGIRDLVYKGEAIDIHKKQNGVTLAQIFDSMLDGYRGQKETVFNITGRENLTDVSNSYTDVSQTLSDGTPVSANYTLPENARRFFLSDAERRKVQVEKIQQARMDETLTAVSEYVAGAEQRWNLTPDESAELAKEMMHAIGLALGEEENEALKHSLQVKMTKTERHNIRKFVNEHRLDAVTTDANVIDAELDTTGMLGEDDADFSFGYNIPFDDSVYQTGENQERAAEARRAEAEKKLQRGEFVPVKDIDLTKIEPSGRRDEAAKKMAQNLMDLEAENVEEGKRHSFEDWIAYIYDSKDGKGNPILSDEEKKKMTATRTMAELQKGINNDSQIHAIKANRLYTEKIPRDGTYAARTFGYEYGEHEIVGIVSHNGRVVAYVPKVFPLTEVEVEGNRTVKILGVSPNSPSLLVYLDGDQVKTESIPVDPVENPHSGEMEAGAMPTIDPVPQAHNQVAYEKIFDMMEEFKRVYKQNIDNALTNNQYSTLPDKTRADLREYIDTFVRQDLMNTKFKTGKFGEIVRDAALLNYSKRIGLDNFLTLLCPYQFWNTRSFLNWASRIGSKGGKLWRRYARLKEVEERNRKEYMPSRVSGMFGIYVPGLPNEYGDALFVSADQKLIVPNFLDPIIEQRETHNAVIATAERLLQEMKDEDSITFAEYQAAMNPETRDQSPAWKEALAKAKLAEGHDNDFADLTRKYLGLNLPMSIMKAVKTGDPADWNQYPMTRLGTAARAVVGNNWIGRGIEDVLSAPERALRSAVTRMTGDDTFAYNEFGAFGDKYIRGKVFDMVVEGKISPEEALQASIEKDGNKIWEEAADRQREEVLLKIQGGSVADAVKKLGKSIFSNDESGDSFKDNFYYLLASIATAPDSKQFVGPAEQTWRERSADLSATYDNNDKESRDQFYKDYPEHRYNSLRWEDNDELALRKYAYNSIMQNYYGMDPADREIVKMSFDSDFNKYVINSKTRAIESMDLNKLVGYAQALNGKVPFISTDKLDTSKANKYNIMQVPETEKSAYNLYISERDRLFPGMSDVNNLYYKLDPADRQTFKKANPKLAQYQEWNDRYKNEHQDVKQFIKRRSSYYDTVEAENACAQFSILTMKELNRVALADKMPNEIYKREIEQVMAEVGTSKDYEWFIRNIKNYILGL